MVLDEYVLFGPTEFAHCHLYLEGNDLPREVEGHESCF